jgi:glucosamine-6-phosphate deaminase
MRLIVCDDREAAGEHLAGLLAQAIGADPRLKLGLSAGGTSLLAYTGLVRRWHAGGDFSFRNLTTFSTDEYVGLAPSDHRSTRYLLNCNLFCQVDASREQTFVPRGDAEDLDAECRAYDLLIEARGGLDLVVLGLGHNGHIGLNEPGSTAKSRTRIVDLTPSTLAAISGSERFKSFDEAPTQAVTMGMAPIIAARSVLIIACGVGKADALAKLVGGKVGPAAPVTFLAGHKQLTLIVDTAAASKLTAEQVAELM